MRALKPLVGRLLAVLLLVQWGGALASCLNTMAWDPAQVLCHAAPDADGDGGQAPSGPVASCPLCAPLPPSLLPARQAVPLPVRTAVFAATVLPVAQAPPHRLVAVRHQPRAPPFFS